MIDYSKLNKENALRVMAVQAASGALSDNVKMLEMRRSGDNITLIFYLSVDNESDREDAQDVADELSVLAETVSVEARVIVGTMPVQITQESGFVIYRQKTL